MTVMEEIDTFTWWLTQCEAASRDRGVSHMHLEWTLGVWTDRALGLAANA